MAGMAKYATMWQEWTSIASYSPIWPIMAKYDQL